MNGMIVLLSYIALQEAQEHCAISQTRFGVIDTIVCKRRIHGQPRESSDDPGSGFKTTVLE